jgi:hypothetical protein
MLLFKSKYNKDLHNFVNCKMCYIFTLTPPPEKNPVCATDYYYYFIPRYLIEIYKERIRGGHPAFTIPEQHPQALSLL